LEREILEISNPEQRRIGHDLHDGVCQQLAGITLMTSSLADDLEQKALPESTEAAKISDLLGEVMEQTRGVARGLFPVRLEQHGLVRALEELAENAGDVFKINCRFGAEDPPTAIENEIALHLYYIVLEAVANAARHGRAQHVQITLRPAVDRYELKVRDDGQGFTPQPGEAYSGMGLRIMHYRARVIGASLSVESSKADGTILRCVFVPLLRDSKNGGHNGAQTMSNGSEQTDPVHAARA
jgi:two-component system CheB/CheR fusion protein